MFKTVYTINPSILKKRSKQQHLAGILLILSMIIITGITSVFLYQDTLFSIWGKIFIGTCLTLSATLMVVLLINGLFSLIFSAYNYEPIIFESGQVIKKKKPESWEGSFDVLILGEENYLVQNTKTKEQETLPYKNQDQYEKVN